MVTDGDGRAVDASDSDLSLLDAVDSTVRVGALAGSGSTCGKSNSNRTLQDFRQSNIAPVRVMNFHPLAD